MDATFFVLMMAAVVAFGIQMPLLIYYARRFDALTIAIYRNLSLALTMLPVLLFAPRGELAHAGEYAIYLAVAGGVGAIAFTLGLVSATYLPIGISQSFRQASTMLGAIFLGTIFFAEHLTPLQLLLIALLLAGIITLSLSKPVVLHLERKNIALGVWIAILAGIGSAVTFLFFSYTSRVISPIVTGYFLELGVGISALIFGVLRYAIFRKLTPLLPWKDIGKIAAISTTAIIGTLCFGYAVTLGSYAIASVLISTAGIVSLVVARIYFGEKITRKQVIIIFFILGVVMALQLLR